MNKKDITILCETYDQLNLQLLQEDISTVLGPKIASRIIKHFNKKSTGQVVQPFSLEDPRLILKDIDVVVRKNLKDPKLNTIKKIIDTLHNNPDAAIVNITSFLRSNR